MSLVTDLGGKVWMLPGRSHHQFSLMEGPAHRLLDVDVLALVQSQHRDREMGMVRNGCSDSIELIATLVEHFPVVTESLSLGVHREDLLALRSIDVDITQGDDFNHLGLGKLGDDLFTAVSYSDISDLDFFAPWLGRASQPACEPFFTEYITRSQCHAGRCHGHGLKKISSVKHMDVLLMNYRLIFRKITNYSEFDNWISTGPIRPDASKGIVSSFLPT